MKLWKKIKSLFRSNEEDSDENWITNHDLSLKKLPGVDMSKVIPVSPVFFDQITGKIITKPIRMRRRKPGEPIYPQKIMKSQIEEWEDYNRYFRPRFFDFLRR